MVHTNKKSKQQIQDDGFWRDTRTSLPSKNATDLQSGDGVIWICHQWCLSILTGDDCITYQKTQLQAMQEENT